ncbi:MAG: ROK family protein [Pirellulaceae bacterium]|nr:ROK family protein [Pirellulaceae bacterium]
MSGSPTDTYWAGFDLGGTKMLATVFNSKFEQLGRKRKRTKGNEGAESGVRRMIESLDQALEEAQLDRAKLAGIGVGCPGPVDLEDGVIVNAVNLGWRDLPLRKLLQDEFRCPVVVVNDVDAGVYGESRFGAAKDARCVLGVFPGTGIGGGCVYEGRIIRGKRLSCMEFGHLQVTHNGRLCGCGLHGCLETEASRLAISAAAAKAAFRGQAPHLLKLAGTNLTDIRSGVLAEAIAHGDEAIEQIVRRAAGFIGVAVANFVHLLAPDMVVLGGGLVEALPKLLVDGVAEAARQHVMAGFVSSFKVVPAKLGDDASVLGSAAWAARICAAG